MRNNRWLAFVVLLSVCASPALAEPAAPLRFDAAFWQHWGDGQAEVSAYELTFPRYGELRQGTAVAIFVTETFSDSLRVKADPGKHPPQDEVPVLKLNLIQEFPTGVYDYRLMTSTFVNLATRGRVAAGEVSKVSFSATEWCGQVWQQIVFGQGESWGQSVLHSYFDGEADRQRAVSPPDDDENRPFVEDALLLWARGQVSPRLEAGEERTVNMLRSLTHERLRHVDHAFVPTRLNRSAAAREVESPAGRFTCDVMQAALADGMTWTIYVERDAPHRIIGWDTSDGQNARMLGSDRFKYWEMNAREFEDELERIGLPKRNR